MPAPGGTTQSGALPPCGTYLTGAPGRALLRRIRRIAGPDLADDIEQDVVEYAIGMWSEFQNEEHLVGICVLKARGFVIDHHRRFGSSRLELRDGFDPDALGAAPDPVDLVLRDEDRRARWAAFNRLPAPLRAILLAHAHADEKYDVVARRRGTTPGAIRVQVHRGRQKLREALNSGMPALVPLRQLLRQSARTGGSLRRTTSNVLRPSTFAGRVMLGVTVMSTALSLTPITPQMTRPVFATASVDPIDLAKRPLARRTKAVSAPRSTVGASRETYPGSPDHPQSVPRNRTKACVQAAGKDICAGVGESTNDPGDPNYLPGDEVYVDAPVAGRQGVTQNQVPVCDKVPPTTGPVGCEHHP